MKETTSVAKTRKSHKTLWIIISLLALFAVVGASVAWYTGFLKKNTADALSAVPKDAVYVLQLNDNENFTYTSSKCMPTLSDLISLNAMEGFQFFYDQIVGKSKAKSTMVVSGHFNKEKTQLLMSVNADANDFARILKTLKINQKNHSTYKKIKIYEVATHHANYFICQHNGIFSAAENIKILQNSINCLGNSSNLISQADFTVIQDVVNKNPKQNWFIVEHRRLAESLQGKVAENYREQFARIGELADWSAYLMTFSDYEMQLTGYSTLKKGSFYEKYDGISVENGSVPAAILPCNLSYYESFQLGDNAALLSKNQVADSVSNLYRALNAKELLHFAFNVGGEEVRCTALPCDTAAEALTTLLDSVEMAPAITYKRHAIYACPISNLTDVENRAKAPQSNYFIENQGYYVFADSASILKSYIDLVSGSNTLAVNQQFVFAQSHLPSSFCYEMFFQNHDHILSRYLSPAFKKKKTPVKSIKVFAFNALSSIDGLVPNNIYLKFGTN